MSSTTPGPIDWTGSEAWSGTRRPMEEATGLPPAAYVDGDFHALERARVFERGWVGVGLGSELDQPGKVLVRPVGSRSVLLTRDRDGELRGFLNSCRHRGTELCETDCTVGSTIRCPYHRWGYSLDGRLVSAPRFDDVPRADFDRAEHGLIPVRVESWGLLLFACLDEATPPLAAWLGDLPERMAGYRLDGWRARADRSFEVAANWKLISENFQEYYHLAWIHPGLAPVSRVDDHYRYQGPGMYMGQTTTPVSGDDRSDWLELPEAPDLDDSDAVSGRFVAIFPNILLSVLPNHGFVIRLVPDEAGRTTEHCTWLLPAATGEPPPEAFETTRTFWTEINGEDIDIVERAQRGLGRGGAPAGPLSPRYEEPLHRFHTMLADAMTASDVADIRIPGGDDTRAAARFGDGDNPVPPTIERGPSR